MPSSAVRLAHERNLEKSRDALLHQNLEERDFTSMIFCIDLADLPSIKQEIRNFIKNILDKYSEKASVDRVYSLNLQFFNLTTGLKKEA